MRLGQAADLVPGFGRIVMLNTLGAPAGTARLACTMPVVASAPLSRPDASAPDLIQTGMLNMGDH